MAARSAPALPKAGTPTPNYALPVFGLPKHETPRTHPRGTIEPLNLVEGAQVEYYSVSNQCWIPAVVTHVEEETGAVLIDIKPNHEIDLQEQQRRLRPRTKPDQARLEWIRAVLRDGHLEREAQAIFRRHAKRDRTAGSAGKVMVIRHEDCDTVGAELDNMLGISGTVCALKVSIHDVEGASALTADSFEGIFWELLWGVHKEFGQALTLERATLRCQERPQDVYDFQKTLGSGTFGKVMLAKDKWAGGKRAIKIISKQDHQFGSRAQLDAETEHLRLLDHPHIVKLYEYFEDNDNIYLVMDYCSGGELQATVHEARYAKRHLPEAFVASVMEQVLMAIAHVHARGVVHLDLKSANIMLMPSRKTLPPGRNPEGYTLAHVHERPHVMVIDLGVAQIFRPGNFKHNRPMGTPATMAGEVWMGEITPKADIFSCGVVLYEQLALSLPFICGSDHSEALAYWGSRPAVPWERLRHASSESVGLCRRMLQLDRHRRPTASQCLESPFVLRQFPTRGGESNGPMPPHIVQELACVANRTVLQKSVALSIARVWPANQLPTVKRAFQRLDATGTGRLEKARISRELVTCGIPEPCALEAADAMDLNRDGTVEWTEFVAACISLSSGVYQEDLRRIFQQADGDGDGLLSQQDIAKLLAADRVHEDVVRDVFADLAGRTEPGARVDWPSFRRHFCQGPAGAAESAEAPQGQGAGPLAIMDADAPAGRPSAESYEGPSVFFAQALGLVDFVREVAAERLWPERPAAAAEPVAEPSEPPEEALQRLAEMGFGDRERCTAVLRRHRNELSQDVIEELVAGS